jgi:hypothetical protein
MTTVKTCGAAGSSGDCFTVLTKLLAVVESFSKCLVHGVGVVIGLLIHKGRNLLVFVTDCLVVPTVFSTVVPTVLECLHCSLERWKC